MKIDKDFLKIIPHIKTVDVSNSRFAFSTYELKHNNWVKLDRLESFLILLEDWATNNTYKELLVFEDTGFGIYYILP